MDAREMPDELPSELSSSIKRYNARLTGRPIVLDDLDNDEMTLVQDCTLAAVMKLGAHEGSFLELYAKVRTVIAVAVRESRKLREKKRKRGG